MHLSDMHFGESVESQTYSIPQLRSIDKIFKHEEEIRKFDRVIITGDLTDDAKIDSFIRARSWLRSEMQTTKDPTGLKLDDDQRLRVIPETKISILPWQEEDLSQNVFSMDSPRIIHFSITITSSSPNALTSMIGFQ